MKMLKKCNQNFDEHFEKTMKCNYKFYDLFENKHILRMLMKKQKNNKCNQNVDEKKKHVFIILMKKIKKQSVIRILLKIRNTKM